MEIQTKIKLIESVIDKNAKLEKIHIDNVKDIESVAYDSTNKRFVVCSRGIVRECDLFDQKVLLVSTKKNEKMWNSTIAISPNGKTFAISACAEDKNLNKYLKRSAIFNF